ncbi:hypothetical protein CHS0354_022905 [Potamilus streckersoni]|uniref:Glycine-rich protein n=1 Tax=Potamilus streckersoni TaxID=2493646 RepID=A0AAE0VMN2_9BIVA|nr:hypothetical protein CHS0354_022905 [Potamilus streckersoni]
MRVVLICCVAAAFLYGVCGQGAGNLFSNPMMMMSLMGGELNMGDMMRLQMMSSMFRGRGTGGAAGGSASTGSETASQSGGANGGAGAGAGGASAGAGAGAGGMCNGPNRMMNMICMRTMMSALN